MKHLYTPAKILNYTFRAITLVILTAIGLLWASMEVKAQCSISQLTGSASVGSAKHGQSFTATCSGNITAITFYPAGSANLTFRLFNAATGCAGTAQFTQAGISGYTAGAAYVVTISPAVAITAGQTFSFDVQGSSSTNKVTWSASNVYAGGNNYVNAGCTGQSRDQKFSVTMEGVAIGTISGSPFCTGGAVSVPYTIEGTFNAGNIFTAQLSDATGSFASPVDIGTLTSTSAGTISATIPGGQATGSGYRIRVNSSNPAYTGGSNSSNLSVVTCALDYTITTTGNAIVITDVTGTGETMTVSENSTNIRFAVTGRTYSLDGGAMTALPADVPLAGITSITINTSTGNDIIDIGAFTANLPNLTVNGGIGDDVVNFNGNITFASNANLDVNLQNDDATPGTDVINLTAAADLILAGTGAADMKASKNIVFATNTILRTVNGNLTLEANQQAAASLV